MGTKVKDKETEAINEELAILHNYIINNFDIDTTIFLDLASDASLLINCKVTPILFHFKQVEHISKAFKLIIIIVSRNKYGL